MILDDLSLTVNSGELLALVGPSGSGKTTLIQHLNGLLKPDRGTIWVHGKNIAEIRNLAHLRKTVGLVFQFPENQFFEETIFDEVAFGLRQQQLAGSEVEQRVQATLDSVGLDYNGFHRRSPFRLSDGEKRRVAIASVVALKPEVLILDEPTAGLDAFGTAAVTELLRSLHALHKTVILVTHDIDLVSELAERVALLHHGHIEFVGGKNQFFRQTELLKSAGIDPPRTFTLVSALRQKGFTLSEAVYTRSTLKEALLKDPLLGSP